MLIAAADVDVDVDADGRAVALSLLPDAAPVWSLQDLLDFGPGLFTLSCLSQLNVESLDERSASLALELLERQQGWLGELGVRLTARVAGPTPPPPDPDEFDPVGCDPIDTGVSLVAATLGMTSRGAQARVDTARAITETLPACQLAMAAGLMGYWHARVVAQAVADAGLDAAGIAAVDARVASKVQGQSWAAFRRTLRQAILAANPDAVVAEHTEAMVHRRVDKFDLLDAVMSQLHITLSSIDAQTVWLGLDGTATQLQTADRAAGKADAGIDAYRSDALVAWANHALADPHAPRRHGRRHHIQFLTDLPSLLGLADNPAELLGYGPIPAALVRDRATEANWRRLIVEPVTGHLLGLRHRHLPPTRATGRLRASPRPALPLPRLQHPRHHLRHRPQHPPPPKAPPPPPTAAAYAEDTTDSKPSPTGPWPSNPTDPANGPHPAAANSSATHHRNSTKSLGSTEQCRVTWRPVEPSSEACRAANFERANVRVAAQVCLRHWRRWLFNGVALGASASAVPPAHIALFRHLCVDDRQWIGADEFQDAIAATNLLPGPASTQLAIFCAWRLRGAIGAIVGGLAFIVPGLALIIALAAVFLSGHPPLSIRGAGAGAGAAVAAVAAQAAWSLVPASWQRAHRPRQRLRWTLYAAAGAGAAIALGPFVVLVLIGAGVVEVLLRRAGTRMTGRSAFAMVGLHAATGGLGALAWVAFKVGALSYGGGFVIIPLMRSDAVATYHWMTNAQFLNAVALGQITPGPVVHTVAVVGYAASGIGGALLAAAIAFGPSFVFVLAGAPSFDRLRANVWVQAFLDGAGPAAIGAIAGSAILLASEINHVWQGGTPGRGRRLGTADAAQCCSCTPRGGHRWRARCSCRPSHELTQGQLRKECAE